MITAIADTHTVVWYIFGDNRLSQVAKDFLEHAAQNGNHIGVSTITLTEIVYLIERSRIPAETLTRLINAFDSAASVLVEIPLDRQIARTLTRIPSIQVPDLPDRIIAATALYHQMPLITRDHQIQTTNIPTIW